MSIKMSQFMGLEISQELASSIGSGVWCELRVITKCKASGPTSDYLVLSHEKEILRTQSLLDAVRAYNAIEEGGSTR